MSSIIDLVRDKVSDPALIGGPGALGGTGGIQVGVFIAGPIDEDYKPKVNNHHWEIATLAPVIAIGLVIDLDCCKIINEDLKKINDCHGWISLSTRGVEHTLGVLIVISRAPVNVWTPLNVTNLGGVGYLPVVVTFVGRNRQTGYTNVSTQWHEELVKFLLPVLQKE